VRPTPTASTIYKLFPAGPAFSNANNKALHVGDLITVGGLANINSLKVFDSVYTMVHGKPFAAR
jgi:para-nitrobenzyl esterase